MKKVLVLATMALLTSCSIDDNGDFHLTWLFWFLLIGFILLMIYSVKSTNKKQAETNAKLKSKGLRNDSFKKTESTYVGGHPEADKNISNIVYRIDGGILIFYSRVVDWEMPKHSFDIPIDSIKDIQIEDATSMENKVTLGRMLLVVVFAFAWKKKKKK